MTVPKSTLALDSLMTLFVAAVFGFAAVDKIFHVEGFVKAINSYRMLPFPMGTTLAPLIISAELVVALGLLWRGWRQIAALSGAALMVVFTIGLVGNKMLGAEGICGCWFSISMAQGDAHFVLNAAIIGMSLIIWKTGRPRIPSHKTA